MSSTRLRLRRASFSLNFLKHDVYKSVPGSPGIHLASPSSTLTPDLQQSASKSLFINGENISCIGNYLLTGETATTSHSVASLSCEAMDITTRQKFTCKILPVEGYKDYLTPYYRVGVHDHIAELHQVIVGKKCVYAFFAHHHGDLHSYVRSARRLRDTEVSRLFSQIASVVAHCHKSGIILRDLKLRKFVFKDAEKTQLMLENLDDAFLFDEDGNDDQLSDRHGCPAYVSPEILAAADSTYSGRAADVWSLGVVLYTMLVGRYPFHDADPISLFRLIRQCRYTIPRRAMSEQAECLVRWILHCNPFERPSADEILSHPWFDFCTRCPLRADRYYYEKSDVSQVSNSGKERDAEVPVGLDSTNDQTVPLGTYNGSNIDCNYDY